jgi:thiol-disulfide isomerase/thioredoxin
MYVRRGRFFDVAYGLSLAYGNKVDSVLRKGAAAIAALPDVTEKELLTIAAVYEKILHNKAAADSVKKQALAAYPQGLAYRLSAIWKLYTTRADTTLIRLWNEFNNRWPASRYPWTDYTDEVYGDAHIFSLVCTSMGNMYYKQHQWKEINKLLSDVPFPMLSYYYDHFVDYALRLDHPPVTMQEIMAVATSIVDTMQARVQSADRYRSGRGLYAPSEWKMLYMEQQSKIFAYHATLLNSQGQSKEALVYATLAQPYASRLGLYTVPFNNTYTTLLNRAGRTAEVLPVIRAAVYQGQYTQEMLEILKKDYIRSKGSDKGFADYVTSLKSKESIEKEQDEIRKAMVNLPATSFKLMNTKGEEVDLDKQKGKIVVIDFWATWCYYCKLAMPGMQMAVNKYQDDQNVAFYFIATMEENPSYKKMIDEFIKSKKYNFNVLYDGKNPATGKLDAAYAGFAATLKSSGIPLKVIIDQEGRIRWTSLGGSANHIAIANEVSYVIDLLKKEKG